MLVKIVIGLITGTLIIGGLTFKSTQEAIENDLNRYDKIEQQINEHLN